MNTMNCKPKSPNTLRFWNHPPVSVKSSQKNLPASSNATETTAAPKSSTAMTATCRLKTSSQKKKSSSPSPAPATSNAPALTATGHKTEVVKAYAGQP